MSLLYILENNFDLFYVVTDLQGNIVSNNTLFKGYVSHIQPKKITDIVDIETDREDFIEAIKKAIKQSPEPARVYARTKHKNLIHRYNCARIWKAKSIAWGVSLYPITRITPAIR